MTKQLKVLQCGSCEPLKAGVHAAAFGLAALCGLYNAAAWLSRRQTHLAVNTVIYTALAVWEHQHVLHHLEAVPGTSAEGDTRSPMEAVEAVQPGTTGGRAKRQAA